MDTSKVREITAVSPSGDIYLQVADSCDRGADVRWQPEAAATKVAAASASDGRLEAIVLRPLQKDFTIEITGADQSKPTTVAIKLQAVSSPAY